MKKIRIIIGALLILVGLFSYLFNLVTDRNEKVLEDNKLSNTFKEMVSYQEVDDNHKYDAILSIPKIKLKKGIYSINDINNDVDSNIMIHSKTTYPNSYPSNVILIAHSGISKKAYFDDLKFLDNDSLVEFYYDHIKYVYKIDHHYFVEMTGKVELDYDKSKIKSLDRLYEIIDNNRRMKDVLTKTTIKNIKENHFRIGFRLYQNKLVNDIRNINEIVDENTRLLSRLNSLNSDIAKEIDKLINR